MHYVEGKIYAIGKSASKLTVLNTNLARLKTVNHNFGSPISVLTATNLYVAVGELLSGVVTVFNNREQLIFVSGLFFF